MKTNKFKRKIVKKRKYFSHNAKTHGSREIKLYKYRAKNTRLKWCKQIVSLLNLFKVKSLKDLGCNYFQLYKEIKYQKMNIKYFGYDAEQVFIKLGLNFFPELKNNYVIGNVEDIRLKTTDVTVISAMLEHSDKPKKILKNAINTTRKILIIRSYFGPTNKKAIHSKGIKNPINFNQFSFKEIQKILKKKNYNCNYILDESTNFSLQSKYLNNLKNNINKRNMFILIALKN